MNEINKTPMPLEMRRTIDLISNSDRRLLQAVGLNYDADTKNFLRNEAALHDELILKLREMLNE